MTIETHRESLMGALCPFKSKLLADGKSPHTVSSYCRDVRHFLEFLENRLPCPDLLNEYFASSGSLNQLTNKKLDPGSINKSKSSLKAFLKWATNAGWLQNDFSEALTIKTLPRKEPNFLSETEQRLLLKTIRSTKGDTAQRDLAMISLMIFTGIRIDALVNLNFDDVNLDDKKLTIHTKGNKTMKLFLNSPARNILKAFIRKRIRSSSDDEALFLSNRQSRITSRQVAFRLKYWTRHAGITKNISPHSLRHTFATQLLKKSKNLRLVQRALGHEYLETTRIYTHILDDELADALELL